MTKDNWKDCTKNPPEKSDYYLIRHVYDLKHKVKVAAYVKPDDIWRVGGFNAPAFQMKSYLWADIPESLRVEYSVSKEIRDYDYN